jgi:hypothetical protein
MKYMKKFFLLILVFTSTPSFSQALKLNNSRFIDFAEKLTTLFPDDFHYAAGIRNYDVEEVKNLAFKHYEELSPQDQKLFIELVNQYDHKKFNFVDQSKKVKVDSFFYRQEDSENKSMLDGTIYKSQKPILNYFYKNPHHFLSLDKENFVLRADPILQIGYGNATNTSNILFQNTRGAEVSAYIDNKIYFYTRILENQQAFLPYVEQYVNSFNAIPQQGNFKIYNSSVSNKINGYDFLNVQAYVGVPISKSVSVEFGHGNNFIGTGIRSMLLSDFATNYLYLKFNTKVWKLHYQNIFAELNPSSARPSGTSGDRLFPKKYMASHYLSIKPFKNAEIGIYETVTFARQDHFELQYLNPVIFYRFAEFLIGSPDNVLIGLNGKLVIKNKVSLYGQLMLDEFNLGLLKQDGWWANKYGLQLGLKYPNAFNIDQLDLQAEYNGARPYTYSHNRPTDSVATVTNYSHYATPLAHPLGANFREVLLSAKYHGFNKLALHGSIGMMRIGRDKDNKNYGSNIFINNQSHFQDFGNKYAQGEKNDILYMRLNASYELFKNYKIFINPQMRTSKSKDLKYNFENFYLGGGISVNLDLDNNMY